MPIRTLNVLFTFEFVITRTIYAHVHLLPSKCIYTPLFKHLFTKVLIRVSSGFLLHLLSKSPKLLLSGLQHV